MVNSLEAVWRCLEVGVTYPRCLHAVGFMLCSQDSEEGGQSAEHALHHAESKVRVVTCCNSRSRRSR